jgi:hypothetical protein
MRDREERGGRGEGEGRGGEREGVTAVWCETLKDGLLEGHVEESAPCTTKKHSVAVLLLTKHTRQTQGAHTHTHTGAARGTAETASQKQRQLPVPAPAPVARTLPAPAARRPSDAAASHNTRCCPPGAPAPRMLRRCENYVAREA